jgi:hypothetical protein
VDLPQPLERHHAAPADLVGVLHRHQVHDPQPEGVGLQRLGDLLGRGDPPLPHDGTVGHARERGGADLLDRDDVGGGLGDDLMALMDEGPEGGLVRHGPGGRVQRRLLAGELGDSLLQTVDGRVVPEDVVADLGLGHGRAHGLAGARDGIRAEVDHGASLPAA